MFSKKELSELSKKIFEQNKSVGWWDDIDRCKFTTSQLILTEISEATEGERKYIYDKHLPHRLAGEVELADALIRVLDLGGRYGIDYIYDKMLLNLFEYSEDEKNYLKTHEKIWNEAESVVAKHFLISVAACRFGLELIKYNDFGDKLTLKACYSILINLIIEAANAANYDIKSATLEKLEFNKNREDHKRENRAKKNGKKF